MMKQPFLLPSVVMILCAFAGITAGCDKDEPDGAQDFIVFGTFYGFCGGEACIETYKLTMDALYEDALDNYPGALTPPPRQYIQLPQEKFDAVKDIIGPLPEALLNETETVIGQPDAGDWGGAYLEWKEGDIHRFWLLDLNRNNLPEQYDALVTQIESAVAIIQE